MSSPSIALIFFAFLSFFLGSVPFGLFISKLYGVDIRSLGSGNIGATNVYRNLGKIPGLLTFFSDLTKGVFAILLGSLSPDVVSVGVDLYQPILGLMAIFGHCYSPFLRGKGGKGVATSFGVFLFLAPGLALGAFLCFVVVFAFSRYVSLASLCSTSFLLVCICLQHGIVSMYSLAMFLVALVVFVRHRENISRLIAGKENRFTRSKTVS